MIINLLDGRQIPAAGISLNTSNQRFYLNETGEDITRLIRIMDKRTFAGFDASLSNELFYQETHPDAPEVGSTSVTGNFVHQILTDPLAAPADAAASAAASIKKGLESPVTLGIAALVLLGLALYFFPRKV